MEGAEAAAGLVGKAGKLPQPGPVSELTGEELWRERGSRRFRKASATRPGLGQGGEIAGVG